jgi:hypothetical protein
MPCPAQRAPRGYIEQARELRCISSRVASIVLRFLVGPDALAVNGVPGPFVTSPTEVGRIGIPWSGREGRLSRRSAQACWGIRKADPGGLATLLSGAVGKLVYVH